MTAAFFPLTGFPEIGKGDRIASLIQISLRRARLRLRNDDIIVVAHKIISKSLGLSVQLADVQPGRRASTIARRLRKNPRKVELILRESRRIVRMKSDSRRPEGLMICEHLSGHVSANAGVDESNAGKEGTAILLPRDPDAEARRLRSAIRRASGKRVGVIVSDTFGRPFRVGLVNVAIGVAGCPAVTDMRGERDHEGRTLHATIIATADEVAAAAGLVMGKTNRCPAVLVRGLHARGKGAAVELLRNAKDDLFR